MEKFYLSKALLKMAGRGGDAFPTFPPWGLALSGPYRTCICFVFGCVLGYVFFCHEKTGLSTRSIFNRVQV